MSFNIEQNGDQATIAIFGLMDADFNYEPLKKKRDQLIEGGCKKITFDFAKVTFIGSRGTGFLLLTSKAMGNEGSVVVINAKKEIANLFQAIKLDKLFFM